MNWVYYILMLLTGVFGLFLCILTLPGLWLIVGATGLYGWLTGWDGFIGWGSFGTLIGLAVVAEVVEFFAGAAGAGSAGGSKRGMIGSIIGAITGGILLTPLFPVVGTLIGVCLGAFAGAAVVEMLIGKEVSHSLTIGAGAAKGRFLGIMAKLAIGVVMLGISAWAAIPVQSGTVPPPTTIPASTPAP